MMIQIEMAGQWKKPDEVKAAVPNVKAALEAQPSIRRYVGSSLSAQVEKAYVETGGKPFRSAPAQAQSRQHQAQDHGQELAQEVKATYLE